MFVVDMDGSAYDAVKKGAERYGTKVEYSIGRAKFIGTDAQVGTDREQRDLARSVYKEIIGRSNVQESDEVWASVHNRWGETLSVTPKLLPAGALEEAQVVARGH